MDEVSQGKTVEGLQTRWKKSPLIGWWRRTPVAPWPPTERTSKTKMTEINSVVEGKSTFIWHKRQHQQRVYQTENSSIMIMYSLSGLKLYHMWVGLIGCDQGGGYKDSRGRCWANIMQDGVVYWQHGTVVEENLHPCIKGHHSKSVYLYLEIHMLKSLHILQYCIILQIFLICSLKTNNVKKSWMFVYSWIC
jgi:hypothetical protein